MAEVHTVSVDMVFLYPEVECSGEHIFCGLEVVVPVFIDIIVVWNLVVGAEPGVVFEVVSIGI